MDICLYASHYGTVGAGRNGIYEEPLFARMVPRAVQILNDQGFKNVYTGGLKGHEIDQHQEDRNVYDVTISNHFNVGRAFLIYNPNHYNPSLNKMLAETNAVFNAHGISHTTGGYPSGDYAMTNYGKSDNYLIEWANCDNPRELAWVNDTEQRAWDLADIVRKTFLDGKPARQGGGATKPTEPTPKPDISKSPEKTDGYGLVAEYNLPHGKITSHDPDRILAWEEPTRVNTLPYDQALYEGEYFISNDKEFLVRLKGDDNYIMRQSKTTGAYFAVGTWMYDDYGQRVVDKMYDIEFDY